MVHLPYNIVLKAMAGHHPSFQDQKESIIDPEVEDLEVETWDLL